MNLLKEQDEIFFTSLTQKTEKNSKALKGVFKIYTVTGGKIIVIQSEYRMKKLKKCWNLLGYLTVITGI